jgi:hypothetical protein
MILSHTRLGRYLRCPRSYRFRYLDGWRDKETRAAMVFGRCFEKALAACFVKKIRVQPFFRSGVSSGMLRWITRTASPGTV